MFIPDTQSDLYSYESSSIPESSNYDTTKKFIVGGVCISIVAAIALPVLGFTFSAMTTAVIMASIATCSTIIGLGIDITKIALNSIGESLEEWGRYANDVVTNAEYEDL